MDIMIIANFCGDFSKTDNFRFLYLAKKLSDKCNVELVTSTFLHNKKTQRKTEKQRFPFTLTYIHEPGYPQNICLKRFASHLIWGKGVIKYLKKRKKPDIVYCAVPSLYGINKVAKYCEKNNIRFVIDVQDLWPEAFEMVFHVPVISRMIFYPFRYLADGIYHRADDIVAVSQTYVDRAVQVNRKCKKGHVVYLGTELEQFDRNVISTKDEKNKKDELWLGYCGTLGSSYDLTCVFDALQIVKNAKYRVPHFIIMGDGPRKREFQEYAKKLGLDCEFKGLMPYDQMCATLSMCDIVVNPITKGAAQSIINKHADYAASGLPVLNTQENEEYRNLVYIYKMGFNCVNNNAEDLAEKMLVLIQDEKLREEMGKNARRCAEEKFDRHYTYEEIVKLLIS